MFIIIGLGFRLITLCTTVRARTKVRVNRVRPEACREVVIVIRGNWGVQEFVQSGDLGAAPATRSRCPRKSNSLSWFATPLPN